MADFYEHSGEVWSQTDSSAGPFAKALKPFDNEYLANRLNKLELLEKVNALNMRAAVNNTGKTYWAVTVMYNTVVYEQDQDGETAIHEVLAGVFR